MYHSRWSAALRVKITSSIYSFGDYSEAESSLAAYSPQHIWAQVHRCSAVLWYLLTRTQ